jgi:hypothetical protein
MPIAISFRPSARALAPAGLALAVALAGALAAPAARAQMNPFDNPVFRKFFNPVVGRGEVYETTRGEGGNKETEQFQIVGKETVDGHTGYWFEMTMDTPQGRGAGKSLFVPGEAEVRRSILQCPGAPPMEMPVRPHRITHTETHGEHQVGSETITVPAGTFACEHWKDDRGQEAWISTKASPITVVKSVEPGRTMVLVRLIPDVHDEITGQVVPFDPAILRGLMRKGSSDH